jgi:bifunctional non-homologous end joining protein LigD
MVPGPPGGEFPGLVRPILATLASELPADEARWAAEFKWDGQRAVGYVSGGGVRLRSRGDRDIGTYPELAGLAAAAGRHRLILDGEIVAPGEDGRPSFALQRRMHARRPAARLAAAVPVSYLLFDLMHLDGQALLRAAYEQRRALLKSLRLAALGVEVPPSFPGGAQDVQAASARLGLEGSRSSGLAPPTGPAGQRCGGRSNARGLPMS